MTDTDPFRAEVRAWLEANCPASMRKPLVADDIVWSGSQLGFKTEDQRLWFERTRDRGWFAPGWPREYGGGGLTAKQARVVEEEMRRLHCRPPQFNLGVWMLGPVLLEFGSEAQKKEHLIPMMQGRVRWCQGFSEPNAGSDLASLKTAAVRDGDDFVVNGSKIWTSYGDKADWMYGLVRTDPKAPKKQEGISFVLIDMKSPGVSVKPIELISGKSAFCQVFFDNVRVPARQLVGPLNSGWTVAKRLMQHERAAMSKFSEGAAPSTDLLEVARPLLRDATGQVRDPELRTRLARELMDEQAFSLTSRRLAEQMLAHEDVRGLASIMKVVQTEQEQRKYSLLVDLMGSRGLSWAGDGFTTDEHDACHNWLLSKTYTLGGGTSEIQLNIIAKRTLGLPG
ncbi:MAG TPA: acyl-CoA dehydrogenase family protein [Nevskiaceae bacterium]|nr:acyl-CoA dehydrogenase family protein [Nevskiaceae bacterium]